VIWQDGKTEKPAQSLKEVVRNVTDVSTDQGREYRLRWENYNRMGARELKILCSLVVLS
jgi:hypothetical protein